MLKYSYVQNKILGISKITKGYKRKMRKDIRKIDEQIIPELESLLK